MSKTNGKWIQDTTIDYAKLNLSDGDIPQAKVNSLVTDLAAKQATSEKGQANGYASLDAGGKIPATQLPNSVMELQGEWNATTNTPSLADGSGNAGDVYEVTVAGTQDLGSGSITFAVGDWVVYSASGVWYKSLNSNEVTSVNGQTGTVVLDADDIDDAATTNKFVTSADVTKLGFISVTQAVDLDTMESDIATNAGNISTNATDISNLEAAVGSSTGLAGMDYTSTNYVTVDTTAVAAISALDAQVKANADAVAAATDDQTAAEVPYTNTTSGLTATDVQAAIDEVEGRLDTAESSISTNAGNITSNDTDISNLQGAVGAASEADITYSSTNYVTNATDTVTSIGALDTQVAANASAISSISVPTNALEEFVLTGTDITNGYVDLSQTPIAASVQVHPDSGPVQRQGVDYTLSTNRVTFAGDLSSTLVSGDVLIVQFQY